MLNDLVGDHAEGPVPAAPALVPVVVRGDKLRWHVRCVSTVPSKLEKVVVSIFLNLPEYVPTNSAVMCIAFPLYLCTTGKGKKSKER